MYRTLHNKLNIDQHNPTNNWRWNQVLQKGKQFMLHMWHPSCYYCCKPGDKSWMDEMTGLWLQRSLSLWWYVTCWCSRHNFVINFVTLMLFFNYSRFLYQWSWQPWYNWNNLERGDSINNINPIQNYYKTNSLNVSIMCYS